MKTVFYLLIMAFGLFFVACGGGGETSIKPGSPLQRIEVTPADPTLPKGVTTPYAATGIYDGSKVDLTTSVTWASSDPTIATIGPDGTVNTKSAGITEITASFDGVVSRPASILTVTDAILVSIAVTPTNPSVPNGNTIDFTATGIYSDNTTQDITVDVTWASSDTGVATISNTGGSEGLSTTKAIGTTGITASFGDMTSQVSTLTVTAATLESIAVDPTNPSVSLGSTQQFIATGTYSDNKTQDITAAVTWASTDKGVATISNAGGSEGLAASVSPGTTDIIASLDGIGSPASTLTVTGATLVSIAVTPKNPSIPLGNDPQFTATGTYSDNTKQDITGSVTWTSSDESVATISNAAGSEGLCTTKATGSTDITATLYGIDSPSSTLTVTDATLVLIAITPTNPSVINGGTVDFTATGTYSDGSTQDITKDVTWASTDKGVATISNAKNSEGVATSVGVGTTMISAILDGIFVSTVLEVKAAPLESIAIIPTNPSVINGGTVDFTAIGTYSDGSTQDITKDVTWASTDTGVARISNADNSEGVTTSVGVGTTTISAVLDGVSDSTILEVTANTLESIRIEPTNPRIKLRDDRQFSATGTYADGSTQDITTSVNWVSSDETVATISNARGSEGLATPVSTGSTNITASTDGVTSQVSTLTIRK